MSVLIEVVIATLFSVIMSTEEMKNDISEKVNVQKEIADISTSEKCD